MAQSFFSIIITSLNPGDSLLSTLESVRKQDFEDYEVIIKDGGSKDGSLEKLADMRGDSRIRVFQEKDRSIYDGMNQAIGHIQGKYVLFLNCGDSFYGKDVLSKTAAFIRKKENGDGRPKIFYGNQYNELQKSVVHSAPELNDFACYRNVPCHQVCFYAAELFGERGYDLAYRVRADYEHFLYSVYEKNAETFAMPFIVASYEGGGFSETKENRERSAAEHRIITEKYLGKAKCLKYRMIMLATLAPLRTRIAESPVLSKWYNAVKTAVYRVRGKR